ncbi:MAG: undecaprenyl/decaprenyl-phosphate alpha-N-acetylglucosaminyl 1-phosphate transferase [Phycisphaerae bacterium]|nr:undecaprenyl/decaprenyl-phosphate alpha-N-acetylglucosaminyl 1-phosphate transferase [Phycisphaerae bacterium]
MLTYICVFFGSAYLAVFITPLVIRLAKRIGAVDFPGIRSVHTHPIPRIGGVAIYVSSVCLIVSLLFLNNNIGQRFREVQLQVLTLLGAATGVFLIGLIDDLRGMPARFKFLVELLGAVALCLVGVRIGNVGIGGHVIHLGWLGLPLTLLWIVGVTNAVNMSDGLDGLATGIAAIACAVIAVFAIHGSVIHTGVAQANDVMMALFALALLGGLSGFLFFNFNPAKIFMGDCGSLFIGFTIAAASVMCVSKSAALVGLALPALTLGIPIFDTLFSMLRRFLERRSLFAPDRSHFHHRLVAMGLTHRHAVFAIYGATLLAAGFGLWMMTSDSLTSLVVFGATLLLIVLLFRVVGVVRLHETVSRLKEKYSFSCQQRNDRRTFETLQLQFRQARDSDQWRAAVCEAAKKMDFAWIALQTTHQDGRVDEELWRSPEGRPDLTRIVTMTIPLTNGNGNGHEPGLSRQLEVAICVNGSLEAAGRRATLFGRLIDENTARAAGHAT